MATIVRPCPHVPGFACPLMPGLECPEMSEHIRPGSAEAKAAFCRTEARRAGLATAGPEDRPGERYRK